MKTKFDAGAFRGLLTITAVICFCALKITGCAPKYSVGRRAGVITKVSEKGILWKSIEGEMLMSLPRSESSVMQPGRFLFSIPLKSDAAMKAVNAMNSGRRVEVHYNQWLVGPWSIDTRYSVSDVR